MKWPFFWSNETGERDMPWVGKGGRARWYVIDRTKPWDFMDSRGPKKETRWGASSGSGESPYDTAERAVGYLKRVGFLDAWPRYPADGDSQGATAFPYRLTIVAIQPSLVILRFDLSAAIEDPIPFCFGTFPPSQRDHSELQGLGWAGTPNRVMFGTHLVDRGSLQWFSPDAEVAPRPLDVSSGRAEISVPGLHLTVVKSGQELEVRR